MKEKMGSNVPMQPNIPPMPYNTSNALKALDSVNATQSNALGEQTKWNRMMLHLADLQLTYSPDWGANGQGDQKLYDFVTELIDEFSGWDVSDTNVGNKMQLSGEGATKGTTFARGHENGLNGLYQCTKNWQGNNEYDIKVRVKETEKSYSMQLVENNSRYSPGHIDMLFSKKDKIMIKKEKSQHSMNVWSDNDFTIYPFRAGIPFHFEKITTAGEKIALRKKWDRER